MLIRNLFFILCLLIFFSCYKEKPLYEPQAKIDPYESYKEGIEAFQNNDFFYANKKFSEAEDEFKQAIKINPNLVEAHRDLGICLYLLKDIAGALKSIIKANSLDNKNRTNKVLLRIFEKENAKRQK